MTSEARTQQAKPLPSGLTRVAFSSETVVQRGRDVLEEVFLCSVDGLWTRQLVHPGQSPRHPVNLKSHHEVIARVLFILIPTQSTGLLARALAQFRGQFHEPKLADHMYPLTFRGNILSA